MLRRIFLIVTHTVTLAVGFGLGIYLLPILTAPPSPDAATLEQEAAGALYTAEFTRDLRGSDLFHWGEGTVSVSPAMIVHQGRLAPGPDYRVYLVPDYVEHEDEFLPLKGASVQLGEVKTFDGFLVDVPEGVSIEDFTSVVVWCEAFGEFITAARYR